MDTLDCYSPSCKSTNCQSFMCVPTSIHTQLHLPVSSVYAAILHKLVLANKEKISISLFDNTMADEALSALVKATGEIATWTTFLVTAPLFFYFLDFKFSSFVCPSEFHPLIWVIFKNSFRKKENTPQTTQNALAPSIFIIFNRAQTWYTASTYPSAK